LRSRHYDRNPWTFDGSPIQGHRYNSTDNTALVGVNGELITYFKSENDYYQITDYGDTNTTLTKYTGDVSLIIGKSYCRDLSTYNQVYNSTLTE